MEKRFSIKKIHSRSKKRKGFNTLFIYDKKLKKRTSIDEFCRITKSKKIDLQEIKSTAYKGDITDFVYFFTQGSDYSYTLNVDSLEELKPFKLFYNAKPVNYSFIYKKVVDFLSRINTSYITLYLFVDIKKSKYANIVLTTEIIEKQYLKEYSIQDSVGNYLIKGS